ncbi:copper homeostasis protein CutC [Paraglaciecola sp. Hal342]
MILPLLHKLECKRWCSARSHADNKLDIGALTRLIAVANNANLQVTFHRAFDALAEPSSSH